MENTKPSNPRMHNPDGVYASEARLEDCFTLRDYFAGQYLQGHLSSEYYAGQNTSKENVLAISKTAFLFADAMLEARF